jgi:hypothetical protein
MIRLAHLSIRRPKLMLALWVAFAAVFVAIGLGVTDRLSPTMTFVPGTESTHAEDLAEAEFGPATQVAILLTGSEDELNKEGPVLVRRLAARDDTRVLSAWDAGETGEALRPSRNEAMIVASVARSNEDMIDSVQSEIDRTVERATSGTVRPHITGTPTLDRAIEDEALASTRIAMLIALPILFVALLIILRAPFAALITTAFGGVTAFVGFGLMTVVGEAFKVDAMEAGLSPEAADDVLEHDAGLAGVSGASGDMREVLAAEEAGSERAALAIAVYVHRLRASIAAMAAAMGGVDAICFTGGVGEHAPSVRVAACAGLRFLGVELDSDANAAGAGDRVIGTETAATTAVVVTAREELEMAAEVRRVLDI